jgi:hypothetical protein
VLGCETGRERLELLLSTNFCLIRAVACTAAFTSFLGYGQTGGSSPFLSSSSIQQPADQPTDCSPITLQTVAKLTFKQRVCFFAKPLLSPRFALAAGFESAFGQFENSPHVARQHFAEFPHRFEVFYARRSARDAAEMIAGYLHHEDPRSHRSNAQGFWQRADSALLSVLVSPGEDGRLRFAYGPLAGSLTSAFVGSVMYRHNETLPNTLGHAGMAYGNYFFRAFFAEFKPEFNAYARRVLRREKSN